MARAARGRAAAIALAALAALALLLWNGSGGVREAFGEAFDSRAGRTCIVMFSTSNIVAGYAGLAATVNERYARRHGYDFLHVVKPPMETRWETMWAKVATLREVLAEGRHDALFFLDSDAIFNRQEVSLDFLLRGPWDLAGCSDAPGADAINAGTLFLRCTPWTAAFVDAWWGLRHEYTEFTYEQKALTHLVGRADPGRVRIFPGRAFNSVIHDWTDESRRLGNFVLHMMATSDADREAQFADWLARNPAAAGD